MIFERADGTFSSIDPMNVWGYKLVGHLVSGECVTEMKGAFVVQEMELGCMSAVFKQSI